MRMRSLKKNQRPTVIRQHVGSHSIRFVMTILKSLPPNISRPIVKWSVIKIFLGLAVLFIGFVDCESYNDKDNREVRKKLVEFEIPVIKENLKSFLSFTLASQEEEDRHRKEYREKMDKIWESIRSKTQRNDQKSKDQAESEKPDKDLSPATQKVLERLQKRPENGKSTLRDNWKEIVENPEKYLIAFKEFDDKDYYYEVLDYNGDFHTHWHSALVSFLFLKDKKVYSFRISYIYDPDFMEWEIVDRRLRFELSATYVYGRMKSGK